MQDNNKPSFFGKIKNLFGAKKETSPEKPTPEKKVPPAPSPAKKTDHAQQAPAEIRPIPTPKLAPNNNEQHLQVVNQLIAAQNYQQVIAYLNNLQQFQMNPELYGLLSVAYNNIGDYVRALDTLALVPGMHRDYTWYYRAGYAYTILALNNQEPETHAILKQNAEACLNHCLSLGCDEKIAAHSQHMLSLLNKPE